MLEEAGVVEQWTEWLATRQFQVVSSSSQVDILRRLL
jgi:hypothetical protein